MRVGLLSGPFFPGAVSPGWPAQDGATNQALPPAAVRLRDRETIAFFGNSETRLFSPPDSSGGKACRLAASKFRPRSRWPMPITRRLARCWWLATLAGYSAPTASGETEMISMPDSRTESAIELMDGIAERTGISE